MQKGLAIMTPTERLRALLPDPDPDDFRVVLGACQRAVMRGTGTGTVDEKIVDFLEAATDEVDGLVDVAYYDAEREARRDLAARLKRRKAAPTDGRTVGYVVAGGFLGACREVDAGRLLAKKEDAVTSAAAQGVTAYVVEVWDGERHNIRRVSL